jgi:branched-chain amino acid transport system ATP-binding protein
MAKLLKIKAINTYINASHILFNVSLDVSEGSVVCILGRNGAGKSTLLKSLIGIYPPLSGSIKFDDEEILETDRGEVRKSFIPFRLARKGIGYVPEDKRVFVNLSVRDNLLVSESVARKVSNGWTEEKIYELFPKLFELRRRQAKTLSGGERQMLAIGRALMGNPKLLLLDEPSSGLAPKVLDILVEQLVLLRSTGLSVILAEQNVQLVSNLGDYVYILESGNVTHGCSAVEFQNDSNLRTKYLAL